MTPRFAQLEELLSYAVVPPHVIQNKVSVFRHGSQLSGPAPTSRDDVLAIARQAGV